MSQDIKLIECPRDAWQGLPGIIPADLKADYLKALISVGFKHIDAVSFVSPKAVPQMADSEEVLKELDPPDDVEIIGIVVNEKGAERAVATQTVSTLGFPYSISETFLRKNQNQSPEDALDELEKKVGSHDEKFQMVFEAIRQLMAPPAPAAKRRRIGFGATNDDTTVARIARSR